MVNPLYLIALLLAAAFLHPLITKLSRSSGRILVTLVLALCAILPVQWLITLGASEAAHSFVFQTAGFTSPLSINFQVGSSEALFLILINAGVLINAVYSMSRGDRKWENSSQVLLMTLLLGVNGLILSRDLFNMFVFMEISSISLYALVASKKSGNSFEAGIKMMIAGGIASAFYLIGVIFLYRITGTLNLDEMIARRSMITGPAGITALFFVTVSLLIELKPFPANGWGADVYQAADVEVSSLISGASATAVFFVLFKVIPLFSMPVLQAVALSGGATFFVSQLVALRQDSVRRMFGYSSIGQIGLLIFVASLGTLYGEVLASHLFGGIFFPIFLLAGNHLLSKAGLFWVSGITSQKSLRQQTKHCGPVQKGVKGILVSALAGFPPFPAFWAKWILITALVASGIYLWAFIILLGSLIEAVYLFRWFLGTVRDASDNGRVHDEEIEDDFKTQKVFASLSSHSYAFSRAWSAPLLVSLVLVAAALFLSVILLVPSLSSSVIELLILAPVAAVLLWTLFDLLRIPFRIQLLLGILAAAAYGYISFENLTGIRQIFALIFIAGSAVQMIALMNRKGKHEGLAALLLTLIFSLGSLIWARSSMQFFFSWEVMTVSSFFLITRGKRASGAALRYLTFSLAGAFSILAALALPPAGAAALLFAFGFLAKMGAFGLHIWLPGAYAESDDDITPLFSSVLSKAGLLMLFLLAGYFSTEILPGTSQITFADILGWVGVLTAFAGAFLALFKEDIKYTLAYSSMGQVGYMILSWALMSQLGWMNSLYLAVTHLLFKGMLFLAIAGVIYRTKTRLMYQMGGLISRMPISFFTVLIGIIALSGVPPLTGFGTKWMLYTALIEKGWYLQAGIAMFASGVAFLYLFRLIHSIFLGQLKDEHREVKEAPVWFLIPQIIGIAGIMLFSMYPSVLLKPLEAAVAPFFDATISWEGYTVLSTLGYWNGTAVMFVTIGVFLAPLIWLLIVQRKNTQKVGQFNIVYAAERPYKPSTTHYAYNFFAPYEKALGFLRKPLVTRWWLWVTSVANVAGGAIRRLYSGNIQTQALWIVLYSSTLLLILQRGM